MKIMDWVICGVGHFGRIGACLAVVGFCLSQGLFALVDQDFDGMGDLWEAQYGFSTSDDGRLFPSQAADFDLDGDGFTNLEESLTGTNPNDSTAYSEDRVGPPGTISVKVNATGPTIVVQTWGVAGKCYELYYSRNLHDWDLVGEKGLVPTLGGHLSFDTTVAMLPSESKGFWRLVVADIDEDGDALTSYEEAILGYNPTEATDSEHGTGDGLADEWELYYFGDLNQGPTDNPDGDPLNNKDEWDLGLDPNVDESAQASARRNYSYDALGRLIGLSGLRSRVSFTFDAEGNLTRIH